MWEFFVVQGHLGIIRGHHKLSANKTIHVSDIKEPDIPTRSTFIYVFINFHQTFSTNHFNGIKLSHSN